MIIRSGPPSRRSVSLVDAGRAGRKEGEVVVFFCAKGLVHYSARTDH